MIYLLALVDKRYMSELLAHSGNITLLTFCQALFEIDL